MSEGNHTLDGKTIEIRLSDSQKSQKVSEARTFFLKPEYLTNTLMPFYTEFIAGHLK